MASWYSGQPRQAAMQRYRNEDGSSVLPPLAGTPLPTPNTLASRDGDATTCFLNIVPSIETAPLGPTIATLSLTISRPYRQRITDTGYSAVRMPDATTILYVGQSWKIINDTGTSLPLNILDFGTNVIGVLPGSFNTVNGNACIVTCLDNSTANGVWEVEHIGNSRFVDNGSITAAALSTGFQTCVSGATNIIVYDVTDQFCPSVAYDVATGDATILETGRYEICAHLEHSGLGGFVTAAPTSVNLNVRKNGVPQFYAVEERSTGYSNRLTLSTRGVLSLTAGDIINFSTFQDSGVDTFIGNHTVAPTTARWGCNFQIRRIA